MHHLPAWQDYCSGSARSGLAASFVPGVLRRARKQHPHASASPPAPAAPWPHTSCNPTSSSTDAASSLPHSSRRNPPQRPISRAARVPPNHIFTSCAAAPYHASLTPPLTTHPSGNEESALPISLFGSSALALPDASCPPRAAPRLSAHSVLPRLHTLAPRRSHTAPRALRGHSLSDSSATLLCAQPNTHSNTFGTLFNLLWLSRCAALCPSPRRVPTHLRCALRSGLSAARLLPGVGRKRGCPWCGAWLSL